MTETQTQHETDTELVLQVMHQRCEHAFTQLWHIHYDWIFGKSLLILKNRSDAEEATSIILTKVWQKLQQQKWDDKKGTFRSWLNIVARHTLVDIIRKNERIQEDPVDFQQITSTRNQCTHRHVEQLVKNKHLTDHKQPTPHNTLLAQETQLILESALTQITKPNHRIAFILRHIEHYSMRDVSRILQRPDGTVKIWVWRCKQELREIISQQTPSYSQ